MIVSAAIIVGVFLVAAGAYIEHGLLSIGEGLSRIAIEMDENRRQERIRQAQRRHDA